MVGFVLVAVTMLGASPAAAESANARYVSDSYSQLLGRSADTEGLEFHLSRLASGGQRSRRVFANDMLFSIEGSRNEVRRAYGDLLARTPDSAGENYWTEHLRNHGVVDLRVLLMASDEYWLRAGGSDAAWLEALYQENFGRASDPGGRRFWLGLIESGIPRSLVVTGLSLSDEALGRRADAHYAEMLDRLPSPGERSYAINTIRTFGERPLRAELWASAERFEQYLLAALS